MATNDQEKLCVGCQNGMVTCNGCEKRFCLPHWNEHLQKLQRQMEDVVQEHDQLLGTLNAQVDAPHLSSRINEWEEKSISKIRDVAKQAHADLQALLDRTKHQLVDSLSKISEQLRSSQASNAYAEKELTGWSRQLEGLQQMLTKPTNIKKIGRAHV